MAGREFKSIVVSKTWNEIVKNSLSNKNPDVMYFPKDESSMFFGGREIGAQIEKRTNLLTVTSDAELQAVVEHGSLIETGHDVPFGLYLIQFISAAGENLFSAVLQSTAADTTGTETVKFLSGNIALSDAGSVIFKGGVDNTLTGHFSAEENKTVWRYVRSSLVEEITVVEEQEESCAKLLEKLDELYTNPGKYLIHYRWRFYEDRYNEDYIDVVVTFSNEESLYTQTVKGLISWYPEGQDFRYSFDDKPHEWFRAMYMPGDTDSQDMYPMVQFIQTNGELFLGDTDEITADLYDWIWEVKPQSLSTWKNRYTVICCQELTTKQNEIILLGTPYTNQELLVQDVIRMFGNSIYKSVQTLYEHI